MPWVGRSDPRSPCVWLLYTSRRTDEVAAQPSRQSLHEIFHARVTRNIPSEASHYANVELMIQLPHPKFVISLAQQLSAMLHIDRAHTRNCAGFRKIALNVPILDSDNSDLASL
jgi:hypothetical protein